MKTLGAALVLAAAGGVWLRMLAGQRRELDTLRRLAALLARMGAEIQGRRTPLPRLMEELAREESRLGPALRQVLSGLRAGEALPELLGRCADAWGLSPWCRTALWELGCAAEESAEALAFARQRVLEELEERRRSQREREKGSAALCFSCAALVVILLR